MLTFVINILKGIVLGCTAVTPGISVGTSAVVLKIFEPVIEFLTAVFSPRVWGRKFLLQLFVFVVPVAVGFITAMTFFAGVLLYFFNQTPLLLIVVFCGLILTNIPFFFREHIQFNFAWWHLLFVTIGFMTIVLLSGEISDTSFRSDIVFTIGELARAFFVGGMLSAAIGLIPGLSGAYVLLLIGYYPTFLSIVDQAYIPLFIPLLVGSVSGLVFMSFILKKIIKYARAPFYATILGLLFGSVYYFMRFYIVPNWSDVSIFVIFIFFSVGAGLSLIFELLSRQISHKQ